MTACVNIRKTKLKPWFSEHMRKLRFNISLFTYVRKYKYLWWSDQKNDQYEYLWRCQLLDQQMEHHPRTTPECCWPRRWQGDKGFRLSPGKGDYQVLKSCQLSVVSYQLSAISYQLSESILRIDKGQMIHFICNLTCINSNFVVRLNKL